MVAFFPSMSEDIQAWILEQSMWFVASAPLAGKHINVSPKGHPSRSLRILTPNQICYLDSTGSGCETIAHIYENGRVTLMFNSFSANPRILRLFCTGRVIEKGAKGWDHWISKFEPNWSGEEGQMWVNGKIDRGVEEWERKALVGGARAIIILDVFKVQTSCGYGVPVVGKADSTFDPEKTASNPDEEKAGPWQDRKTMPNWQGTRNKQTLNDYWKNSNWRSLDGCPGLKAARRNRGNWLLIENVLAWWRRVFKQWEAMLVGMLIMSLMVVGMKNMGSVNLKDWKIV